MSLNSVRLLYISSLKEQKPFTKKSILSSSSGRFVAHRPDGNHFGWVVVLSSLIISMLSDGYSYTCGQFYEQFLVIYGQSETITSIYISIMNGTIYAISPLASGLVKVYGCRLVSILGSILSIIGMLLSTIVDQSIYWHCLTIGFMTGCGLGLLFITQVVIVTIWFDRQLALATGLAECGSGFGMAMFSLLSDYFIRWYTWKGAMIILAGFMSTSLAFSGLYAEPDYPEIKKSSSEIWSWSKFIEALKETIDFSLLRTSRQYQFFVISQALLNLVFFFPVIIVSDRIKRSGLAQSAAGTYVCFGVANGLGRIIFGWISSSFEVNNLWLLIVVTIGMGSTIIITNLAANITSMQIYYCLIGIFFGANVCLTPVVLVDMLGQSRMANAYGIVSFFDGLAALIGPPLINLTVKESSTPTNDIYSNSIWISGSVTFTSVLFLVPLIYMEPPRKTRFSHSQNNLSKFPEFINNF